ncbi:MAG: trypsin-like peptidase domain-containing protein [Chloroflexi bacterium]|nr:trypsin-like peptidase domain-containing protein [Chloroflexota bacterium]
MALIPPFFLDCVVAIGFDTPKKTIQYSATGFLYGKFISIEGEHRKYRIFLVTNKHVFEDSQIAWLRFNPEGNEPAKEFQLSLVDGNMKRIWLAHPNPDIDLAIIGINVRILKEQNIHFSFFKSDEHIISRAQALELGVSEGDGIFVLGFPMGIIGEKRNFVIVRQGCIARIGDTLSGNSNEFLIDTSIFPGNSGGPVVSRPEIVSIQGTNVLSKAYLLGVVAGYVPYRDVAVSAQTQQTRIIFEENSGLATVVPIDFLVEIVDVAIAESEIGKQGPPIETAASTTKQPDT